MSRISIFGAGYVGLVTGACFADLGHSVVVRDIVPERIDALRRGEVPIYEPGLDELLERNQERLRFTLDVADAIDAEFLYICVGTPPTYSGDADLSDVWTVIEELAAAGADRRAVVVMKSTVPVGTGEKVRAALDARGLEEVGYASNPEFTAEGTAVRDFMEPDRIVVGAFDDEDGDAVAALHEGIAAPVVRMDVASAEMVKLASNAFLMTRVSFINEIANVCEATGADVVKVAEAVGLDHRLGPHFLRAGIGYGGSCLEGRESVLVRAGGRVRLLSIERLFEELSTGDDGAFLVEPEGVEVLSWRGGSDAPEFLPVTVATRRPYSGWILEVRTKMGRRLRCTPDHPFVTRKGIKLASELTVDDWLPLALGTAVNGEQRTHQFDLLETAPVEAEDVIVRVDRRQLVGLGARSVAAAIAELDHPHGPVVRAHDIVRSGALRRTEHAALALPLAGRLFGTARNGTYVPGSIAADEGFWRVVGLYIAEGHCSRHGDTERVCWSFHPRDEFDLVEDVLRFWRVCGVKARLFLSASSANIVISSRILCRWWLGGLGLAANCYEQRLPDAIWEAPLSHKRALLAGLWRGDGSWSYIAGGPSVVLEYGTVSRELADGMLRLLGELGIVARLKVGRTAKSTTDTYWLVVSGAGQVEQLLDLVPEGDRRPIQESIAQQRKRIAPTGYRRERSTAWARIVRVEQSPFAGSVYSLEVPGTHTFVSTGGIAAHNCFPKDSLALKQLAANSGYHFQLLNAVIEVNELQKRRVIGKLKLHLGSLRGKTVALLGLAFKPNTDDLREAPSLVLAGRLLAEGAAVRAWDPVADASALLPQATLCSDPLETLRGADAAVLVTEWPQLRDLSLDRAREVMQGTLIVDGRNFLDPDEARRAGFVYEGIGRAATQFASLPEIPEPDPTSSELAG